MKELVDNNKARPGLACDSNGGGGGSIGTTGGIGFSGKQFQASKSDSIGCKLKSDAREQFDEQQFIADLQLDVEKVLNDSGATITDRGHPGPASFYVGYSVQNIKGRVQVSGTRIGGDSYSLDAALSETGK